MKIKKQVYVSGYTHYETAGELTDAVLSQIPLSECDSVCTTFEVTREEMKRMWPELEAKLPEAKT